MKDKAESEFFHDSGVEQVGSSGARRLHLTVVQHDEAAPARRARPVTLSLRGVSREETEARAAEYPADEFADLVRPTTRSDCRPGGLNASRPCPYVSCKAHLALDVSAHGSSASIKLNFPDVEVWDMAETCLWDVVDRGGASLHEVAALMNVSEERVRQIEVSALREIALLPWARELAAEGD